MTLTKEQLKALEPYETNFMTAIRSKYARHPGQHGVKTIHEVYSSVVRNAPKLNTSCSSCVLSLLVDCGRIYFKDKAEMEAKPKRKKK